MRLIKSLCLFVFACSIANAANWFEFKAEKIYFKNPSEADASAITVTKDNIALKDAAANITGAWTFTDDIVTSATAGGSRYIYNAYHTEGLEFPTTGTLQTVGNHLRLADASTTGTLELCGSTHYLQWQPYNDRFYLSDSLKIFQGLYLGTDDYLVTFITMYSPISGKYGKIYTDSSGNTTLQAYGANTDLLLKAGDNIVLQPTADNYNAVAIKDASGVTKFCFDTIIGQFAIGTLIPYNLFQQHESTVGAANYHMITNAASGAYGTDGLHIGLDSSANAIFKQKENLPMMFYTNGTLAATIGADQTTTFTGNLIAAQDVSAASLHAVGAFIMGGEPGLSALNVGQDDVQGGIIRLYGGADAGGTLGLFNPANYDTNNIAWWLDAGNAMEDFRFNCQTVTGYNTILRITGAGLCGFGTGSGIAPTARIHQNDGNATATYHKFTAGTTTGVTVNDGFDIGIDASGNAELRQRENLPLYLYTNNTLALTVAANQAATFAGTISASNLSGTNTGDQTLGGLGGEPVIATPVATPVTDYVWDGSKSWVSKVNWDTAYTDRLKWDGGATDLVAATGRASLELGGIAVYDANDYVTSATGATHLTAVPDPIVPADGTQNVTGAVTASGAWASGPLTITGATSGYTLISTDPTNYFTLTSSSGLSFLTAASKNMVFKCGGSWYWQDLSNNTRLSLASATGNATFGGTVQTTALGVGAAPGAAGTITSTAGITSGGANTQETYCIRKIIRKTGITDNSATGIFKITTTNETGDNDGGAYSCRVHGVVSTASLGESLVNSSKSFLGQFCRTLDGVGTAGANSAVLETETAEAAVGGGTVSTVTMTTANGTNEYQTEVLFLIDVGAGTAEIVVTIELDYNGFATAPVIAAL